MNSINSVKDKRAANWPTGGTFFLLDIVKRMGLFVALLFVFFSCTDLQTANNETTPEISYQIEKSSENYLMSTNLLPEPEVMETYQGVNSASKSKSTEVRLYKQVLVSSNGEVPGSNGAPVVDNFADAIARVAPGGIIKVFKGEYILEEIVEIDRPVTLEPMGNASPIIRNTSDHAFRVTGNHEGIVIFNGLTFKNPSGHSSIVAEGSEVLVTSSTFDVDGGTAGAFAWKDAKLTIEESFFGYGVVGAFASGENTNLIIRSSSFNNHSHVTLQYQWGADGLVEENTMTDCGTSGCTRAFLGSEVDMLDNYLSDDISDAEVNGFFHHIVIYAGATGRVNGNLFDGCGHGQCIAGIDRAVLEVSENEFRIYEDHKTRFVIVGSDGTGGNDPQGREVDITVTDNVITGIGGNYGNDPGNPDAYAIKLGGLLIESYGRMEAHRNTIVNANMGISVLSGGVLTDGKDNKIQHVRAAVAGYDLWGLGQSFVSLQSNDFTGYATSILNDSFDPNSDLTCNWWGTAAGPQNMQGAQSSGPISTPWATGSVAGSSVTSCTGGI